MLWIMLDPRATLDHLGFVPEFLTDNDPRSAREQINDRYISGWQPFEGFKLDPKTGIMTYPGDPRLHPIAETHLRNECIWFYECAWLTIMQPDGSFEVARLD